MIIIIIVIIIGNVMAAWLDARLQRYNATWLAAAEAAAARFTRSNAAFSNPTTSNNQIDKRVTILWYIPKNYLLENVFFEAQHKTYH